MDLQRTRDPRGSTVDENARLSCAATIKKIPVVSFFKEEG